MKIQSVWQGGFKSVVENFRGHEFAVDLPMLQHGENEGPIAVEAFVMSFAGCITTYYAKMAKKLNFDLDEMRCDVKAESNNQTIEYIELILHVKANASKEKKQQAFDLTCNNCPAGIILRRAGVIIESALDILPDEK
ncbi:MAG: OsmC family protein [Bacteroidales bacterium]|jgi:uncharacterized OsmC-like protein|nr:OsmC family protein [Bacteroidales bacterium]